MLHVTFHLLAQVEQMEEMGQRTPQGLVKGHAYAVTSARPVEVGKTGLASLFAGKEKLRMVRLRNPWAGTGWTGAFGEGEWCYSESKLTRMFSSSAEWSRVSNDERTKLGLAVDEEGDFWMTLEDFVVSFTDMSLCHLLKSSWFQLGRSWCEENLFGEWTVGERGSASDRAGGCINHRDTYLRNPQFRLDVITDEEVVTAYLLQDSVNDEKNPNQNLVIGFHIMQVEVNRAFRVQIGRAHV